MSASEQDIIEPFTVIIIIIIIIIIITIITFILYKEIGFSKPYLQYQIENRLFTPLKYQ